MAVIASRSATPATERLCAAGCGTVLSAFNPDELCAACQRRRLEQSSDAATGVDLDRLIAGLLLLHSALHGEEPLDVGEALAGMGIVADSWRIQGAVRRAERRHGLVCRGVRGRAGYSLVDWEVRYRPVVGFGGAALMERDSEGRFSGVAPLLQQRRRSAEVRGPQMRLLEPEREGS